MSRFHSICSVLLVVALAALAGCASVPAPGGGETGGADLHLRYGLAFEAAGDHRDFSRIDLIAPELKLIFDRTRDVYVLDQGLNPYNIEFVSGSVFRWDRSVEDTVQDELRTELERSDWVRWVRPITAEGLPDLLLRVNVLELHYLRTEQAYFPQVTIEVLVLDPARHEVVEKLPARVSNEFSVPVGAGNKRLRTLVVEDWMETDLREQMRRAIGRASEKIGTRLEELLSQRAVIQRSPASANPSPRP